MLLIIEVHHQHLEKFVDLILNLFENIPSHYNNQRNEERVMIKLNDQVP